MTEKMSPDEITEEMLEIMSKINALRQRLKELRKMLDDEGY